MTFRPNLPDDTRPALSRLPARGLRRAMPALMGAAMLLPTFAVATASAHAVRFTDGWKALEFFRIPATSYRMGGDVVDILARQSSSVIFSPLPPEDRNATSARWRWSTTRSVPPTDLTVKGGDDRNIALYFVFLDSATARRIGQSASIRKLLTSRAARILVYTFGGDRPAGSLLPSPYLGARGAIIIRRPAMTGSFSEKVDLAADFRRAFGSAPQALVGLALASDSDDTGKVVEARVADLVVE